MNAALGFSGDLHTFGGYARATTTHGLLQGSIPPFSVNHQLVWGLILPVSSDTSCKASRFIGFRTILALCFADTHDQSCLA